MPAIIRYATRSAFWAGSYGPQLQDRVDTLNGFKEGASFPYLGECLWLCFTVIISFAESAGPCATKFTVDSSGSTPQFTPVEGPTATERLFYGNKAPLLAGATIQDAFLTSNSTTLQYNFVIVRIFGSIWCCRARIPFDILQDSTGATIVCDEPDDPATSEPRCLSTGSTDRTDISDHSTWQLYLTSLYYLATNGMQHSRNPSKPSSKVGK